MEKKGEAANQTIPRTPTDDALHQWLMDARACNWMHCDLQLCEHYPLMHVRLLPIGTSAFLYLAVAPNTHV